MAFHEVGPRVVSPVAVVLVVALTCVAFASSVTLITPIAVVFTVVLRLAVSFAIGVGPSLGVELFTALVSLPSVWLLFVAWAPPSIALEVSFAIIVELLTGVSGVIDLKLLVILDKRPLELLSVALGKRSPVVPLALTIVVLVVMLFGLDSFARTTGVGPRPGIQAVGEVVFSSFLELVGEVVTSAVIFALRAILGELVTNVIERGVSI